MDNYLMMTSSAPQEVTSAADLGEYQFYLHLYFSLDSQKEMKNLLQLAFLSSMDFQLRNHLHLELWWLLCYIRICDDLGSLPKKITKMSEDDKDYIFIGFLLLKSEMGIFRVGIALVFTLNAAMMQ